MTRSIKWLEERGWHVDIVERHIPHAFITKDLFHMFDLVAIRSDSPEMLGIQVTSRGNVNPRLKKIRGNPILGAWCQGDRRAVVHGWSLKGRAGTEKVWTLHEVVMTH